MALTQEQLNFKEAKPVEGTVSEIKNNYILPIINEEKRVVEEYENNLFGKMGCGGAFSCGCLLPMLIVPTLALIIEKASGYNGSWLAIGKMALIFTLAEYFVIVYYNNSEFRAKHKNGSPIYCQIINRLVIPLLGVIGMDIKDDEKIKLSVACEGLEDNSHKLSLSDLRDMGKRCKRGLTAYSGDLLDLSTCMADGAKLNITISEVISSVHVYKKHGSDKNSRKEKATIKVILCFPANKYTADEGCYELDESTVVQIVPGDKYQKVVVKKVVSGEDSTSSTKICISYDELVSCCHDAVASAYSMVKPC